jgi:uncharacterized protein YqeY
MTLEQKIIDDLKEAMKKRDELITSVLRMLKSQLMLEKTKKDGSRELDDQTIVQVFQSYARKLVDAIEQFKKGNREDLVERHESELAVVKRYLPQEADEEEIRRVIEEVVAAAGASSPADMGKVMGPVMERLKGRCDGKKVSRMVRERLEGK